MEKNEVFTTEQIFKFQTTSPTKSFLANGFKYTVHETIKDHECKKFCYFGSRTNCPAYTDHKRPVCFATHRLDRKSVYFTKHEK